MKHQQGEKAKLTAKSSVRTSAPVTPLRHADAAILRLQETIGNQAVLHLMRSGVLQAKLTVSRPDDIYEQEADRVADQVMRMPEPPVQTKPG